MESGIAQETIVPSKFKDILTDTGWSLKPILDSMVQWGNNYREMQK